MNVIDYVKKYGDITFDEEKFNEVDNIIFAALSYIDFSGIVPTTFGKIRLEDAAIKYLEKNKNRKLKMAAYKTAKEVLIAIYEKKRYKDLHLYNYCYIGNIDQQFSAVTIELTPRMIYISFEGTDHLVSGWEEDFRMAYMFPVKAQRNAINYINRFIFSHKHIIIGGHSKGGNLALVAGMYANRFTKKKIVNIYSNDGPGLRRHEFNSREYREAALKLISIIPSSSIVGLLFRHSKKYKVIESNKKGPFAHDLISWQVEDKEFKKGELNKFSQIFDESMAEWLNKYTDEEREMFVISLFDIFRRAGIDDLEQVLKKKTLILKLLVETRGIPKKNKDMIKEFLTVIFEYFKGYNKNTN